MFGRKLSQVEIQSIKGNLQQLQDSAKLINTTVKPDIFFKRLNFTLDILLKLEQYEKYRIFKGTKPSQDYKAIIENLGATVDNFIDRALEDNQKKISSLKTEKAKRANYEKFASSLVEAFDRANVFWTGNKGFPHYSGPLYTEENYRRVKAIYDSSGECI